MFHDQNLKKSDMMSQSDPYVLINVLGSSLKPIKTKVLKGNANPVWNETFGFDVRLIELLL